MVDEIRSYRKEKLGRTGREEAGRSLSIITYGDDFVVFHESKQIVLKAEILIREWLKTIRLELKSSKTRISHSLNPLRNEKSGFDFLGFTIRQYTVKRDKRAYKLLIKPSHQTTQSGY